jgi:hypothetical protein
MDPKPRPHPCSVFIDGKCHQIGDGISCRHPLRADFGRAGGNNARIEIGPRSSVVSPASAAWSWRSPGSAWHRVRRLASSSPDSQRRRLFWRVVSWATGLPFTVMVMT